MSDPPSREDAPAPRSRRSIFSLARNVLEDSSRLIRQEITLARLEVLENARSLTKNAGLAVTGGAVALLGLLVLVEFLVIGLGVVLSGAYWLSALLVALVLLTLGVGAALLGLRTIGRASIAPTASLESAKQTGQWLASEADDFRKLLQGQNLESRRGEGASIGPTAPLGTLTPGRETLPRAAFSAPVSGKSGTRPAVPMDVLTDPAHTKTGSLSELARRVVRESAANDVPGQAAKVAFFMFLSVPPALLVIFGLSGIFGGVELAESLTSRIDAMVAGSADDPNSAASFVIGFIDDVVARRAPGPLSIGLLLGLWAASTVFFSLTAVLNRAFDVVENRSWGRRRLRAMLVMVVFVLLFLGASVMLVTGPWLADAVDLAGAADVAWTVLQWPLSFLLVVVAFFLIYYLLPNYDGSPAISMLLKASAIAAALWVLATLGFRVYVANFGSYGETYGFVGGVLVLLLWTYLTSIVILVGAEIAAELKRAG